MNEEQEQIEKMTVMPSEITFQQDRAMLDIQVSTAKAYPRNITRSVDNIIATVTADYETAEACNYAVPRGGNPITGPSVHLARIMAQYWGNLVVDKKVIGVDDKYVYAQATARDLETNYNVRVEVKKLILQNEYIYNPQTKKKEKTGKMVKMSDDMITVTGNAAMAVAERNAIFAVIPRGHVNTAYKKALSVIVGDVSDEQKLIAKRKKVVDQLIDVYGVTEAEILALIGKAAIKHITAEDLATLIGVGQAIRDGDTTVDEAFRRVKPNTAPTKEDKVAQRLKDWIAEAQTIEKLRECNEEVYKSGNSDIIALYEEKLKWLGGDISA